MSQISPQAGKKKKKRKEGNQNKSCEKLRLKDFRCNRFMCLVVNKNYKSEKNYSLSISSLRRDVQISHLIKKKNTAI